MCVELDFLMFICDQILENIKPINTFLQLKSS